MALRVAEALGNLDPTGNPFETHFVYSRANKELRHRMQPLPSFLDSPDSFGNWVQLMMGITAQGELFTADQRAAGWANGFPLLFQAFGAVIRARLSSRVSHSGEGPAGSLASGVKRQPMRHMRSTTSP